MPIRFVCESCGARLSVSSRKAGTRAKCPKCHGTITVPGSQPQRERTATVPRPDDAVEDAAPPQADEDPFAQFAVYDVESELVYDTDTEQNETALSGPVDPSKLAVSRTVLYAQGALLGVVALFSFAVGVLVGLGGSHDENREGSVAEPCLISGTVSEQDRGGEIQADVGAVAIVVPRDVRPDQKADIVGLRPQDPEPAEGHLGLRSISSIGGDYARTDEDGRFELQVPDRGSYFLLIISARASRGDEEQSKLVLAQIGRFFQLTPNLFEGHAYRWQEESVRRDLELNFVFP
jgi:hypothetical protein